MADRAHTAPAAHIQMNEQKYMTTHNPNQMSLREHLTEIFRLRDEASRTQFEANQKHFDNLNNAASKMLEMQKEANLQVTKLTTQLVDKGAHNEARIAVLENWLKLILIALALGFLGYLGGHVFGIK